ncbi:protein phosphatase CheZ [Nitrospira defluvii]|nr:protein phosphatase CheZ [Nitrospira defluvii]
MDAPKNIDLHNSAGEKIENIESKSNGDRCNNTGEEALYGEVGDLAKYISTMTSGVDSAESFMEDASAALPKGSSELLEVTRATEEATQQILDDTEKIIVNHELMAAKLESLKATLFGETLSAANEVKEDITALNTLIKHNKDVMFNLVATLSFQDPAGQQIKKVDAMLRNLQSRLLKLVVTFGKQTKGNEVAEKKTEALLSELGDSIEGKKLDQDLVDSVLKEYGF